MNNNKTAFMIITAFGLLLTSDFSQCQIDSAYDKLFHRLTNEYNRYIRPGFMVKPTIVDVFLYVGSLRSISEATMTFEIELYYREYWQDSRLAYDPERFDNRSRLSLHASLVELMWIPDTFLPNAIDSENPDYNSVTHRSLLRLETTGHILYSRRISVTAECPMDLTLYPFDHQICALSIESYGYDASQLIYRWRAEKPVSISSNLKLPQFKIKKVMTKVRNITLLTGNYSRLECCFLLDRSAGFYFVQIYFPASAIVVISWLFLWMQEDSYWQDMISVILANTFLYYSFNGMLPQVSYVKAVDLYLTSCFLFVFGSLAKVAVLRATFNRVKIVQKRGSELKQSRSALMPTFCPEPGMGLSGKFSPKKLSINGVTCGYQSSNYGSRKEKSRNKSVTFSSSDCDEVSEKLLSTEWQNTLDLERKKSLTIIQQKLSGGTGSYTMEQSLINDDGGSLDDDESTYQALLHDFGIDKLINIGKAIAIGLPISFVLFAISYFAAYMVLAGQIRSVKQCTDAAI